MKNLLRVKVNGNGIMKFCQSDDKEDFYCYSPRLTQGNIALKTHFSFHSKTGRTTFKTTSLQKDQEELLPDVLSMLKNHSSYQQAITPTDLDLFKRKIISFDGEETFYPWFQVGINMQNTDVSKYIRRSKTIDGDFQSIFDIRIDPPQNEQITVSCFIGKNVNKIPEKKEKKYDMSLAITETNFLDDKYTFIFCFNYGFPDLS